MQEKVVIEDIKSRPILDSRDEWTIETEIFFSDGSSGIASVPSGKSTGLREAHVVSVHDAISNIHGIIKKNLKGFSATDQFKFDERLKHLDGTENKRHLGGNTILSASIAFLKALAHSRRQELWKLVKEISESEESAKTRLFINVINGGLHSGNNLPFQEYIIIPKASSYRESIEIGNSLYHTLSKVIVEKLGPGATCLGDEGGFAPPCRDSIQPFELIFEAGEIAGMTGKFDYGMDSANGAKRLDKTQMSAWYKRFIDEYNLHYLEDPFAEDDVTEFQKIKAEFNNTIIAGDDLTTTNPKMIREMIKKNAISGVIIKPNQIGTVSEAVEAVRIAKENSIKVVVSHRSGETNDDFIADFAHGVGAYGLKLGSPARGERVAKYNRLLAIEN